MTTSALDPVTVTSSAREENPWARAWRRLKHRKGAMVGLVVVKHALRNALIPVVTLGTIEFGRLLAGAVLTEQIFTIPGFGKLIVDAVFNRDYPVVQGVVLATALIFVSLSLIADMLYMAINPRLRTA